MITGKYDTLSGASDALTKAGYTDEFRAEDVYVRAIYADKNYRPSELKIVRCFRFDGMTNPEDDMELFAIEADDGLKGTMVMPYGSSNTQNEELITLIRESRLENRDK